MQNLTAWRRFLKEKGLGVPRYEYSEDGKVRAVLSNVFVLQPGAPWVEARTEFLPGKTEALERLAEMMAGALVKRESATNYCKVQAPPRFEPDEEPTTQEREWLQEVEHLLDGVMRGLDLRHPRSSWPEQARRLKRKADALDRLARNLYGSAGTEHWPVLPESAEAPEMTYDPERLAGTVLESLAGKEVMAHERRRPARAAESPAQAESAPTRVVGAGFNVQGRLELASGVVAVPGEDWVDLHIMGRPWAAQLDSPDARALRDWLTEWIGDASVATNVTREALRARDECAEAAMKREPEWAACVRDILPYVEWSELRKQDDQQARLCRLLEAYEAQSTAVATDQNAPDGEPVAEAVVGNIGLSISGSKLYHWLVSKLSPTAEAVTFEDVLRYVAQAFEALCTGALLPEPDEGAEHLVRGEFQSDKYPTCPAGKVPLSTKDPLAQDLLWEYAARRHAVDTAFSSDVHHALLGAGYEPTPPTIAWRTGGRVERNVYAGHRRVCQVVREKDARTIVAAVNLCLRGTRVSVNQPALFTFTTYEHWQNVAPELYDRHQARPHNSLALDALGRPCTHGAHFGRARDEQTYPIRVYALSGCSDPALRRER